MKKILVAIDGRHGAWEALSHAFSLARRIEVRLNILLVESPGRLNQFHSGTEVEGEIKKKLELLIETAKAEGIDINYFIAEGNYEDEVINFVSHNKIDLLVHEANERGARSERSEASSLRSLRHRIACTVEVVAPKKT
jgi:nucleotide-binding universal stress UspA family protein